MKSFKGKMLQGKYLLQESIGEGNFGAVFKSQQYFLSVPIRRVAVKVSKHTEIDIEKAKEIFAEVFTLAEAMDELTDTEARSHLVHIYDVGILPEESNRMFVVMEYVNGTNLARQFESFDHQIPENLLLKWVRQICCALKGLHMLIPPLIHRDLKPDNILLGIDLNVMVVDFGLSARLLHLGYVPNTVGTVTFMAPETSMGESVPASDIYSIGIMMYQGLTGQLPFSHLIPPLNLPNALRSDWLYEQKSIVRPAPPSSLNNTVTPQLDALVLRCLEFNPSKRFFNAGELLKALDELYNPPPDVPEDVAALNEGRCLKDSGDLNGARSSFEQGLKAASRSKETRFALLRELGENLVALQEYQTAAVRLVDAWKLTENSAILRSRKERFLLLGEIEDAYQKSGNRYNTNKYEKLKSEEMR